MLNRNRAALFVSLGCAHGGDGGPTGVVNVGGWVARRQQHVGIGVVYIILFSVYKLLIL